MCWISGRDGEDRFLVVVGLEGVFILCLLGGGLSLKGEAGNNS